MVIGSNINNYLECKWIKCSNQKTHLLSGCKKKKKKKPVYILSTRDRLQSDPVTHTNWKWEAVKRYYMKMEIKKKNGVAVLVLDNIDFKIKTATRYKEGHYIMIKGSIQEAITIISIYAPT